MASLMELEAGEDVVVDGISEVIKQVLHGANPGEERLDGEAEEGEHGEPAILDLLELELLHLRLALGPEAERVEERAAGVGRLAGAGEVLLEAEEVLLPHGARRVPVLEAAVLGEADEGELEDEEGVRVGPVGVGARGGITPVWNHGIAVSAGTRPSLPRSSGATMPTTPIIAVRPLNTSP